MFNKFFKLTAMVLVLVSLISCGKTTFDTPYLEANPISENTAKYYELDLFYDYDSQHYKFRLPEYWKGKFFVEVNTHREDFYEINSHETDSSGLLFSIYEYEDTSYRDHFENYTYILYDKRYELHYIMVTPDEDKYVQEFETEYKNLKNTIPIILSTLKAE